MTRTSIAVVLEVIFGGLAFGWRSWVQWRRTGSTGFILPRRDAPPLERIGASLFVLAIVLLVAAPIVGEPRIGVLDNPASAVVGSLLAAAGIGVCVAAQLSMGDSWRIGVDTSARTSLVTDGIFAKVRNPIFSAMLLAVVGLAVLLASWLAVAAVAALLVGLELQVRFVEEPYLRAVHGAAYVSYAQRAGRFLPGVGCEVRA